MGGIDEPDVRAARGQDLDPSGASHGKPVMKVASPLIWELVIDCEVVVSGMISVPAGPSWSSSTAAAEK
ncbi:hypothetical protein ACH4SK_23460 [Streptomyces inhibens]|uniref:hypothetical protein n=1 Tax=Streptomyces inhibens TaxID=2293571 RepID=UPI00379925C4